MQVQINSRGLVYSVVLLLGSVALTVSKCEEQFTLQTQKYYMWSPYFSFS